MFALIWDMDDTLYDLMTPFVNACGELGISFTDPEHAYARFRFRGDEVFEAAERGEIKLEDSRVYRFQKAMEDCGITVSAEVAESFQGIYKKHQMTISLTDTMRELLTECKEQSITMGMITNGPGPHQRDKIKALGMEAWIAPEDMLISGEVGTVKPYVEIYHLAEERLHLDPANTYMIGDNYMTDMPGALEAGWKTIWFNRRHKTKPEDIPNPDFYTETEEDLARIIRTLISGSDD